MVRDPELADTEIALRRCQVLYGPMQPFLGRGRDIARLREQLTAQRIAIIKAPSPGIGATRLAAEFAHAAAIEYPGGITWVRHRGSSPKEVAADVVEALALPTATWLHWPFVSQHEAQETMWRGLAARPPALVVVEGWPSWVDPSEWTPTPGGAHVLGIADAATAVEGDAVFTLGPLDDSVVLDTLRSALAARADRSAAQLTTLVAGDSLALAVAFARLHDASDDRIARYAESLETATTPDAIIVEAFESLSPAARTFLMILSCLDAGPVPLRLIRAICSRVAAGGDVPARVSSETWGDEAMTEVASRGLAPLTALGEPSAHARTLGLVRDHTGTRAAQLYEPIAAALADELDLLDLMHVHEARRLVPHARHAAWFLERSLSPAGYDRLLASTASSPRPFEAGEAAQKRVALIRGIETPPGAKTLEALTVLGHALSQRWELPDAQGVLREALAVAEQIHGAEALEVASVIGLLTRAIGLGSCGASPPEQLELKQRALSIRERAWGSGDQRLEMGLWDTGLALAVADRDSEALALFERATRIAERVGSRGLVNYVEGTAGCLGRLGRIEEALTALDRALELRRRENANHVTTPLRLAEEFLALGGRYGDLMARVDRVLAWPELTDDDDNAQKAQANARLRALRARTLAAMGRTEEASRDAEAALRTLEPLHGPGDKRILKLRALVVGSNRVS
jgi:tetratricopeptide (TPR) repeat protein